LSDVPGVEKFLALLEFGFGFGGIQVECHNDSDEPREDKKYRVLQGITTRRDF
jgi:hypothetical protein